jgi:DNA-directed RNA polymerase subunit RPC12/RpoP
LILEMYRRDQFRQDLLIERCDELLALDDRLQELDTLMAAAVSVRRAPPPVRCACGAPLIGGSHFCANCGRPVAAAPPVVGCAHCGSAVSADAKFCATCGRPVAPEQQSEAAAVQPREELLEALPAPVEQRPDGG